MCWDVFSLGFVSIGHRMCAFSGSARLCWDWLEIVVDTVGLRLCLCAHRVGAVLNEPLVERKPGLETGLRCKEVESEGWAKESSVLVADVVF